MSRLSLRPLVLAVMLLLLLSACSGPDDRTSTATVADDDPTATSASPEQQEPPTATDETEPPIVVETPTDDSQPPVEPTVTLAEDEPEATDPPPTEPDSQADPTATPQAELPLFDPANVSVSYQEVGAGFDQPIFVTHAGDGSGRAFVLEKIGVLKLLDGTVVLDIQDQVVQTGVFGYEHEQGMLGVAFHPNFAENGYLYVHYNDLAGDHVFSRFTMGQDGIVDRTSEHVMLTLDQPEVNFQGGMMVFGNDGYLYMGIGTGGSENSLQHQAQDLNSLYGKILRIDVDAADPYGIPADNPFVGRDDARPEVWAYGLRNPWRFAFDRATGDLYIGGPGQFTEEWIDFSPAGDAAGINYGWPMYEGSQCWEHWEGPCDPAGMRMPILTYPTYDFGNCVVIGGYVYRGTAFPALQSAYFFGDFCSGNVWAGYRDTDGAWQMAEMGAIPGLIGSFGEDEAGELYICDINNGIVYQIVATAT